METLDARLKKRIHASLYALLFLTVLLGLSVLLESCTDKCEVTEQYSYYEPVYTSLAELRSSISAEDPQPLNTVGKIYFKSGYLFVNEPGKGIHVIDNRDASQPHNLKFIRVPGSYELAIKGNTLYTDSFIDLVALDISNLDNIHEINRMTNIFSGYNSLGFYTDPIQGVVSDWVVNTQRTVTQSDCNTQRQSWGGMYYDGGVLLASSTAFDKSSALTPGTGSGPGAGGSMARFTIAKDHLYALDRADLRTLDITSATAPVDLGNTNVSWDIETLFPHGDNLFIGSRNGMHIMDISTPDVPKLISTYQHVRVCDPVVVQDTLAYITLRSGSECEGFTNQLEVINIKNLNAPVQLKVYPMYNPHGLGISGTTLFVCDGTEGLKIYDASNVMQIDQNLLAHYGDVQATDIIPLGNTAMMIGEDGIYQYDYTNPAAITLLSKIDIQHAQ